MPIAGILFAQVLLSAARKWLDRMNRLSAAMVEAAMTMYLVHVAIMLWLSVAFIRVSWPAELEIALIIVLSAASYAFDCVVKSSSVLTFLFNGTWEARGGMTASIAPRKYLSQSAGGDQEDGRVGMPVAPWLPRSADRARRYLVGEPR
jgi:hypothetical protein